MGAGAAIAPVAAVAVEAAALDQHLAAGGDGDLQRFAGAALRASGAGEGDDGVGAGGLVGGRGAMGTGAGTGAGAGWGTGAGTRSTVGPATAMGSRTGAGAGGAAFSAWRAALS
jgi:hypothetical protein